MNYKAQISRGHVRFITTWATLSCKMTFNVVHFKTKNVQLIRWASVEHCSHFGSVPAILGYNKTKLEVDGKPARECLCLSTHTSKPVRKYT